MDPIDVDEIAELNFPDADSVEVVFKDGAKKLFTGAEFPEAMEMLKHWTPPTA